MQNVSVLPICFALLLVAAGCTNRSASGGPAGQASVQGGGNSVVAPVMSTSITLGDGTSLSGNTIRIVISNFVGGPAPFDGPSVELDVVGQAGTGAITWAVTATFDVAMFKTGALIASVSAATSGPGIATVEHWISQIPTMAASGRVSFVKNAGGVWTGTISTDRDVTSATLVGSAQISCFVPISELGVAPNGTPGTGLGPQMAEDTTFKTPFCAQFR